MNKKFFEPEYSVITFDSNDIMTASTCTSGVCLQNLPTAAKPTVAGSPVPNQCVAHVTGLNIPQIPLTRQ